MNSKQSENYLLVLGKQKIYSILAIFNKKSHGDAKKPLPAAFLSLSGPGWKPTVFTPTENKHTSTPSIFPDEKLFLFSRCASVDVHAISKRSLSSSGARAELNENGKGEEECCK